MKGLVEFGVDPPNTNGPEVVDDLIPPGNPKAKFAPGVKEKDLVIEGTVRDDERDKIGLVTVVIESCLLVVDGLVDVDGFEGTVLTEYVKGAVEVTLDCVDTNDDDNGTAVSELPTTED